VSYHSRLSGRFRRPFPHRSSILGRLICALLLCALSGVSAHADPPGAPDSPSFSDIAADSVKATAPALPDNATSLTLQQKLYSDADEAYTDVATGLAGQSVTPVTGLSAGTYYVFRYVAMGADGNTAGYGNYVQTLPPPPTAPATPGFSNVQATSLEVPVPELPANASQLKLQRKQAGQPDASYEEVAQFDSYYWYLGQTAQVYGLNAATTYTFRWLAAGEGGTTAGASADVTTAPAPPDAPDSPQFSDVTLNSLKVIAPALPANTNSLTLQQKLYSEADEAYADVATGLAGQSVTTVTGLNPSTYYVFRYLSVGPGGSTAGYGNYVQTLPEPPEMPQPPTFQNVTATTLEVPVPALPANTWQLKLQQKLAAEPDTAYFDVAWFDASYWFQGQVAYVYYLNAHTTYTFRWVASGSGGTTAGPGADVTTAPAGDPEATPTPEPTAEPTPEVTPTPEPTPVVARPDVMIRKANETQYLGDGVYHAAGAGQTKAQVVVPETAAVFSVKVQNDAAAATSLKVTGTGDGDGWTVKYLDAPQNGNDITASVAGEGWMTPALEPQAFHELWVEVKSGGAVSQTTKEVLVSAVSTDDVVVVDAVKATTSIQKLAKIQFSLDGGATWLDTIGANGPVVPTVVEKSVVGFRAIKANPDVPWPGMPGYMPLWKRGAETMTGETIWWQFPIATPPGTPAQIVTGECGDQASVAVRVRPAYDVMLQPDKGLILAGPGPESLRQTALTVTVIDEHEAAVPDVRVRFHARYEDGTAAGEIGAAGLVDDEATTDADGHASVLWTSGARSGEVHLEAEVLYAASIATGEKDRSTILLNKGYLRLDYGAWQEDANGHWSRPVTASAWFLGQKIAGRGVSLSVAVAELDGAPLAGGANVAPLDAATGTTDANGKFVTTQRWNPPQAGEWPHDYAVTVTVAPGQ